MEPVLAEREWLAGTFSVADILMADVLRLVDRFDGLADLSRLSRLCRARHGPPGLREGTCGPDGAFRAADICCGSGRSGPLQEAELADPFEFADGMVKQLLTLATGSLGGIVAIFDDRNRTGVQLAGSGWLNASIVLLAISVLAGLLTLGSLTAQLAGSSSSGSANALGVRIPAMVQMLAFAGGIIAVAGEVVLH
jgi:hypothetical protein